MTLVGQHLLLGKLLFKGTIDVLLASLDLCLLAGLLHEGVVGHLLVKHVLHRQVHVLGLLPLFESPHGGLDGPTLVRVILSLLLFSLFGFGSPFHLLFPIFIVLALLLLFLLSLALLVEFILLYLVLEFFALFERFGTQGLEALLLGIP